jgi:hypothetical protein
MKFFYFMDAIMDLVLSLAISFFALLATFYQSHLQRVHNQMSVKPLGQIDLRDRDGTLFIRIQNNGVGPMIVDKLTFTKGSQNYYRIQDCLDIDSQDYIHIEITDTNKKVIIPGGFLELFSKEFNLQDKETMIALFRDELSALNLKVEGHDIYNNRIIIEKSLQWFARYKK